MLDAHRGTAAIPLWCGITRGRERAAVVPVQHDGAPYVVETSALLNEEMSDAG
ncbi:MAG: hypothetical protein JO362_06125 [Streptomycetaceae bacterium]|nr:hypothetical protein [Streptomycetaceae bacterium]